MSWHFGSTYFLLGASLLFQPRSISKVAPTRNNARVATSSQHPICTISSCYSSHASFLDRNPFAASATAPTMAFPPQTPQRPLPGAFFNTPAPNRMAPQNPFHQNIFQPRSNTAAGPPAGQPVREAPAPQILQPIQRAARTINDVLLREASFPDLDSYVRRKYSDPL